MRRNKQLPAWTNLTNSSAVHGNGVVHYDQSYPPPVPHHRLDTFWTVCTCCKVQYEYLRKYLNKKLSCKNCRGVFMAVETGVTPINSSYPFHTWSPLPTNGYAGNGVNGVSYYPSNSLLYNGNRVHLGHGSEYSSNLSFQWSSISKAPSGVVIPNGFSTIPSETTFKTDGKVKIKSKEKRKLADMDISSTKTGSAQIASNPSIAYRNPLLTKTGKIDKRRRVDTVAVMKNLFEDAGSTTSCVVKPPNAANGVTADHPSITFIFNEPQARRFPVPPLLDFRKILVAKAKIEIAKKLDEMRLANEAVPATKKNVAEPYDNFKPLDLDTKRELISINVPDSEFHDFDNGRSELCFQANQIWALYDEEDGMPRLYCMIRQVISLDPFKMHITYLNAKTSSEFGSVDWVGAGFTKSCGKFKAMHSDIVDQVNIFSHVLSGEIKAGRGGCVRIYPKTGDIWAVYRNWPPDWDSSTPDEMRRQYDMVEVTADYNEERGVPICPLVKLESYNTVYRRSEDKNSITWVPKQEMFRFSHQVPSYLLEGDDYGLPDGCWDLDPAATPDDLLHSVKQLHTADESKTNLLQKKLELHHDNEQAAEGYVCVAEPASQGIFNADALASQGVNFPNGGRQHDSQFANEQVATEELNPYSECTNTNGVKHLRIADKQVEVEYSVEKRKLELGVELNQLQHANGQAAAEGLQPYLDLNHNLFHIGYVAGEPKLISEMRQNRYSYASEHRVQGPESFPTVKQYHQPDETPLVQLGN